MPRPDVSVERTEQIIAAAVNAFSRLGFDKTRMDDIANEAGLSKGTLYLYFESKNEIIMAVLDQFFTAELADAVALLTTPGPESGEPNLVAGKIEAIVRHMIADTEVQLGQYLSVWLEFYAVAAREDALREKMTQYMKQFIDLFTTLIQQGIDSGEFRAVNAHAAALVLSAQLEGLLLFWAVDRELVDLTAAAATAVDLLLQGLAKTVVRQPTQGQKPADHR